MEAGLFEYAVARAEAKAWLLPAADDCAIAVAIADELDELEKAEA